MDTDHSPDYPTVRLSKTMHQLQISQSQLQGSLLHSSKDNQNRCCHWNRKPSILQHCQTQLLLRRGWIVLQSKRSIFSTNHLCVYLRTHRKQKGEVPVIKRTIAVFGMLFLIGCGGGEVTQSDIEMGTEWCVPHGGIRFLKHETSGYLVAKCSDGIIITGTPKWE